MTSLPAQTNRAHDVGAHGRLQGAGNSRVLAITLRLPMAVTDGLDPLADDASHRLRLLVERVRGVVGGCYTRKPAYGAISTVGARQERLVTIYFPFIVIDNDPVYQLLTRLVAKSLNEAHLFEDERELYGKVVWAAEGETVRGASTVGIEIHVEAVEAFAPNLCDGCESLSVGHITAQSRAGTTTNTISLKTDQFTVLLRYFVLIHERDPNFFQRNLRYIACAYYRQRKHITYAERERRHVTCADWIAVTTPFGVDADLAAQYFREAEDYAYSTVTMEEVLRDYAADPRNDAAWVADKLALHFEAKFRHDIKELIIQEQKPSDQQLWELFANFIRHDHFYAEKSIWKLDETHCVRCSPQDLRPVVQSFTNRVRDGKITVLTAAFIEGDGANPQKVDERIEYMCKPFENRTSCKYVEEACANYLSTKLKTAVRRTAIPFRDVVLVFDQGRILERRAFMEDQFTSTSPVAVRGFGHTEKHRQAIKDVKELLEKMFVHKENVEWNIRWMGSLLAHRPERVCSIWYGPKGGNAKTTLSRQLLWIFGEAATQCRADILIANKNGGQTCTPFEADLIDRVLAIISEPQRAQIYASSTLNEMTGGDPKKVAKKYENPTQFDPTAKVLILCNAVPQFDNVSQPLLDRLHISHCYGRFTSGAPMSVEQQRKENHYPADNDFWTEERRQALAWIIIYEGFPAYAKEGLKMTSWQKKELAKWSNENNDFAKFGDACVADYGGKHWRTTASAIYNLFMQKFSRKYGGLTYDQFIVEFTKATSYQLMKRFDGDDQDWYQFYHPECPDREPLT